ncbi:hypothetical protein PAXINDRAFT_19757 [Paxillus involutus ATCC 200175]|uniref:Protein kinase domain-containing protein n=1 Tax=Paxillus involutus ATCC 200175 TaxID=664439 RepID=A0A0C9TIB2_PAXIN|nr:hypothetical protein PAXINDRAFT_19757 [Paxillus involutus ATCC 200175]
MPSIEHARTRGNPEHPNKFGLETAIPQSHHSMDSVHCHPSEPREGGDGVLCNSRLADTCYADGDSYLEPMKRSDPSQDPPPVETLVSSTIAAIPSMLSRLGSFVRSNISLLPLYVPRPFPALVALRSNLAVALFTRSQRRSGRNDLDEAIEHNKSALFLRSEGHPERSALLNNLGIALVARWDQRRNGMDLKEAIKYYRSALLSRPAGHPDRSYSLNDLGEALVRRFAQQCDAMDIDEAIESGSAAGSALGKSFDQQQDGKDLDEASDYCQTAEDCAPTTHPLRLSIHQTFSFAHLSRWHVSLLEEHFHHAMQHYASVTACAAASALSRLQVSLIWVWTAETHQYDAFHSALNAYAWCLRLLDCHISAAMSISSRYDAMKHFPVDLSVDAASCALRCGNVPHALELLEQGRALLWTQLARFHTLLDDLRTSDPRAVALKFLRQYQNVADETREKLLRRLKAEIVAWHRLQHPNIAPLYGVIQAVNSIAVSPWCNNGTIMQYIEREDVHAADWLWQIASGVSYLHNMKPVVVHGDLKGTNTLVSDTGDALISDFGLSNVIEELSLTDASLRAAQFGTSLLAGSTRWMAPELILTLVEDDGVPPVVTTESDVFSLACVAAGELPYPHRSNDRAVTIDIMRGVKPSRGARSISKMCFTETQEEAFWGTINRCWDTAPVLRPTMTKVGQMLAAISGCCS